MQRAVSAVVGLILAVAAVAQNKSAAPVTPVLPSDEISGMYSFLEDGEFVQIDVQDGPPDRPLEKKVGGFISRYGDLESDKGAFLDHFIREGKLAGRDLSFTTQAVHGVWFDFKGRVERGAGKTRAEEAYFVLRGTLTKHSTDAHKKESAFMREVGLKSFPQDAEDAQAATPDRKK
ncbi:MAG TPA: hypothetical protein VFA60_16255 [Terriglobales bacterium]|nr:hypothetical protein [Terriglobales bacterium]